MTRLSRILVAVDFSEPAQAAFEYALALARSHGAELTVVHAVAKNEVFRWRARERATLVARLHRRAEAADVPMNVRVQQGAAAGVILLHTRPEPPDLIVLGTHQRRGLDHLRTGSVAERVLRRAAQPVLIVPPRDRAAHDRLAA